MPKNINKTKVLNLIDNIQLSRRTVTRRAETIGNEIRITVKQLIDECDAFSICLDESTYINDNAQLIIWVRTSKAQIISEDILSVSNLAITTTAEDIMAEVTRIFEEFCIDPSKLVSITTDGAASMCGIKSGFVTRMKNVYPHVFSLHCILHQESLCAKMAIPEAKPFADFIMRIVNMCI